jgi:hypothetical protein
MNCAASAGIPVASSSVNEESNSRLAAPSDLTALAIRVGPIPGVNVNAIHAKRPRSCIATVSCSTRRIRPLPFIDPHYYKHMLPRHEKTQKSA